MPTLHLLIKGKVQGVFYRASAKEMANKLKLNGWIKNTTEGNVEATVNGSEESIEQFIDWCRKGLKNANVTDVLITPKPDDGLTGFQIIK